MKSPNRVAGRIALPAPTPSGKLIRPGRLHPGARRIHCFRLGRITLKPTEFDAFNWSLGVRRLRHQCLDCDRLHQLWRSVSGDGRGQLWGRKLFRRGQRWHHLSRFRFFRATFRQLEKVDLPHHFVWVNWPGAAAFLDILVDDLLQLFSFGVIKHNSKDKPLPKQVAHFYGVE